MTLYKVPSSFTRKEDNSVIHYFVYFLVEPKTHAIVPIQPKRLAWNDKTPDKTKESFMRFNITTRNRLDDLALLAGSKEEIMRREKFPEEIISKYIEVVNS